jgi:hypothetical protein
MAWIGLDLDDTLVQKAPPMDPATGQEMEMQPGEEPQDSPVDGAVDAVNQLMSEGHRLTVFTARFKAMPDSEKQRMKEQIEQELQGMGFPPLEVWTGTHKPEFDLYVGNEAVTFDGDWGLALAQLQYMMNEQGLTQPQPEEGEVPEEAPPEEA